MRVTKPNWVEHTSEKNDKSPIFSISVHPDGTRLATGGLDHKVKIWSTLPILDEEAQADDANAKLLCTMSSHTGPVLAVRWAHHGRYLASGSDDQVVMMWDIDPNGGGRLWGSDEVNVENWKALRRLVGHVADVVDIAWSRDDSMLASVGLDSTVWIWDGYTFDRIRKIDVHQGFVKGVCWDPVGNFLATQSDDKTVKIWNTETWTLVESVGKPFERSPQSTFFRRLSWSPDGAFIAASNAMNGPVFVAAVIEREGWNAEISFVGHENTIQVAAFNPCLFFGSGDSPGRATASCMVALGADDLSISIWRNTMHKPLVVLREVFGRQLLDLCWSNDGLHLYGCSADGTIVAVTFEAAEFPELAHADMTKKVLDEYEYKPVRSARGTSLAPPPNPFLNGGPSPSRPNNGPEVVNILQVRKSKPGEPKRRVNLGSSTGLGPAQPPRRVQLNGAADAFAAAADQPLASTSSTSMTTAQMLQGAHNAFTSTGTNVNGHAGDELGSPRNGKRKASGEDERLVKGRVMGPPRPKQVGEIKEIRAARAPPTTESTSTSTTSRRLPLNNIQTVLRTKLEGSNDSVYVEVENATEERGVNKLVYVKDGQDKWLDFLPCPVLVTAISAGFVAAACEDGSVYVYSPAGRHLSSIRLESPCYDLHANRDMLMIVTSACHLRVLNVRQNKVMFPPVSFSHLLDPPVGNSQNLSIHSTAVRTNGVPVIITSRPSAYAFDSNTRSFVDLFPRMYSTGSPLSAKLMSSRSSHASPGPVHDIELTILELVNKPPETGRQKWWDDAMVMGHYEARLNAAFILGSGVEYRANMLLYAKYLGDGDWRDKAEELIKDLMGPVYYPNASWIPTVLNMTKRSLLKEVLNTMKNTVAMKELAIKNLEKLKEIAAEQAESET